MMPVVQRAQPWLGTLVSVGLADERADARAGFAAAFAAMERVHVAMSPQSPVSDVARFNLARCGEDLEFDPWTIEVLRLAARFRRATDGLFDVALGSSSGDTYRIRDARTVIKLDHCRIDLGGIAKGYAVDRAVLALRAQGIKRGFVNAGGDLRVFGRGAWPVGLRGEGRAIALERGAVATSQYIKGRSPYRDDALIAPTARAVCAVDRSVTVVAPRCAWADALTKVVALSGDREHRLIRALGARVWLQ